MKLKIKIKLKAKMFFFAHEQLVCFYDTPQVKESRRPFKDARSPIAKPALAA